MPQASRADLRRLLRQRRSSLPRFRQLAAAQAAFRQVARSMLFRRARRIAFYLASDGEIDPACLIQAAWQQDKQVYLPIIQGLSRNRMLFQQVTPDTPLYLNEYRIPEPCIDHPRQARDMDLILLPLVGFDRHGGRLGMGGGFYDRALANLPRSRAPRLIGMAHHLQEVSRLPLAPWDVSLDAVVTDREWIAAEQP